MTGSGQTGCRRPLGVWIFALYFAFTALLGALGWMMLLFSSADLSGPEGQYYGSLTVVDYLITFSISGLMLAAAAALLLLHRAAVVLLWTSLVLGVTHTCWHFSNTVLWSILDGPQKLGLAASWLILLWGCLYSLRLSREGMLN